MFSSLLMKLPIENRTLIFWKKLSNMQQIVLFWRKFPVFKGFNFTILGFLGILKHDFLGYFNEKKLKKNDDFPSVFEENVDFWPKKPKKLAKTGCVLKTRRHSSYTQVFMVPIIYIIYIKKVSESFSCVLSLCHMLRFLISRSKINFYVRF